MTDLQFLTLAIVGFIALLVIGLCLITLAAEPQENEPVERKVRDMIDVDIDKIDADRL